MNIMEKPEVPLEILIATMNRTSLDFLDVMFQNNSLSNYQILIINQTTDSCILNSSETNIRVINSFEKGLSKSRNLAIENAIGNICLLADDDIVYLEGFEKHIMDGYNTVSNPDVLTFKTLTTDNKPFSEYPKRTTPLKSFGKYVLSIEISFRRSAIVNSGIRYDEFFGLGATFQDSENYLFLLNLQKHTNFKLFFVPEFIVMHQPLTSSDEVVSDRLIFARCALNYKLYGNAAYVYVFKYLFYLIRHRLIGFNEINDKFKVAQSGIHTFKKLNKI